MMRSMARSLALRDEEMQLMLAGIAHEVRNPLGGIELFGGLLNTTKVFAHCPPILKAAKQLSASIEKSGRLPAALVPLVYLRVALINGCPF